MSNSYYITTAIEYVNSPPHVGHAYEKIGADIIARAMRMRGMKVIFQMGTDEHSTSVARKAAEVNMGTLEFCDKMVEQFVHVWEKINLSYDVFIRTTSERHVKTVRSILRLIHDNGDIYLGKYKGYYCTSCDRFYQEKDLVSNPAGLACPVHDIKCEWLEEENYFFKLSKYREPLLNHIEEHPEFILPEIRRNEIVNVLKDGLDDVSISRSGSEWGVPLPWDENTVTYVWFDALINYLSAIGYSDDKATCNQFWPAQMQIIGKDITRFHCIYWPAMLMSAGMQLPETIFGHGFVHIGGEKMSKTTGTVVDPLDIIDRYGADALRYFLAREIRWGQDGDFTWDRFVEVYNSDLANNLGNLVQRILTMITKYTGGVVKPPQDPEAARGQVFDIEVLEKYQAALDSRRLHDMAGALIEIADSVNLYIDRQQPWSIAKQENSKDQLTFVLFNLAESLRWLAICAFPLIPDSAEKIWQMTGLPGKVEDARYRDLSWGRFPCGCVVQKPQAVFPRIEEK